MTDPGWQNSTVLSGDAVEEVTALKNADGKDIVVTGSISLCHTLISAGLVDEYRLFVYPTVQGSGRGLFPAGLEIPRLRLLETMSFARLSADFPNGSFGASSLFAPFPRLTIYPAMFFEISMALLES